MIISSASYCQSLQVRHCQRQGLDHYFPPPRESLQARGSRMQYHAARFLPALSPCVLNISMLQSPNVWIWWEQFMSPPWQWFGQRRLCRYFPCNWDVRDDWYLQKGNASDNTNSLQHPGLSRNYYHWNRPAAHQFKSRQWRRTIFKIKCPVPVSLERNSYSVASQIHQQIKYIIRGIPEANSCL